MPPPLPAHFTAVEGDEDITRYDPYATRTQWGRKVQEHAIEVGDLAQKVQDNAAELDDQLQQKVAPELARYQQLLELIMAGKGTVADNIEMERLGALLNLESADC